MERIENMNRRPRKRHTKRSRGLPGIVSFGGRYALAKSSTGVRFIQAMERVDPTQPSISSLRRERAPGRRRAARRSNTA